MVDRNIVNKLGLSQEKLNEQVSEMFSEQENEFLEEALRTKVDSRLPGTILTGTIVSQIGNDVIVEVGLKSEGIVDASEFEGREEIVLGKEVEVLLEDTDSESGLVLLSKRKADVIRGWETILNTKKEGDVVKGKVIRRIKGGLLVNIGVPVFLPASQVDIRKPGDISRFIGKAVECKILKIDIEGRNIVISRRKLVEEERRSSKEKILTEIEVGQLRKGVVKNIADFGVFVDLGGLDGLLHISDLSWGRISHPSEVVELDQELECIVVSVDKDREKISLGLKQKTSSPWEDVEERYPVGARVKGKIVNVMSYGVFVRLEDGVEGLVHISEMSWTRRLAHPGEIVNLGDEIEVVVLDVNKEKQEISLGLKQTGVNPWAIASQKYPAGTILAATVRSLTNFGVFVEIEPGIDGMIHISDLSWTRKYNHPGEAVQKGKEVKCIVLEVNEERRRVSLGIKQMTEDPWIRAIPEKYIPGHIIKGKVAKLTNFGAFVELEPDLEGLLHISELADRKINKPQDIVEVDDEVEVKILKVDTDARKIGLSLRRVQWAAEEQTAGSGQQQAPADADTEKVLSDADVDQLTEPQEKADEGGETDAGAGDDSSAAEEKTDGGGETDAGASDDSSAEEKTDGGGETDAGASNDSSAAEEKTDGGGETDAGASEDSSAAEEKTDGGEETDAGASDDSSAEEKTEGA
ncbi:MAG: 30S ribosomal protein S1 [Planctomycetota bacterium]|jgi:small subunit ribosomal protein S1